MSGDNETTAESGEGSGLEIQDETGFDALLEFLHKNRGFDFSGYKRASLKRRISRRMQMLSLGSFPEYLDHLEVHPDEFPQLFNMLLINVTSFFRDAAAWQALTVRLTGLLEEKGSEGTIRVWCAGCSSGEEPYTMAMILCEAMGPEALSRRVKIYATDIDEEALMHARQAIYPAKSLEAVSTTLIDKYFTQTGTSFVFSKEQRRSVIFGRHDLVQDAPIPRVDILACRNTLMYFNAEAQTRILQRLQFALNPSGILMLGKAEMLLTHSDLFTPLDLKLRLFARVAKQPSRNRGEKIPPEPKIPPTALDEARAKLLQATYDVTSVAQVVIDVAGRVALVNHRAAHLFSLSMHDLGRAFHELELSYRPAELRSCIEKVRLERRPMHLKEIERNVGTTTTHLDIDIVPLVSHTGAFLGTVVSFIDVTQSHRLQGELRRANTELEAAHEELESASEELETTNEELQSTVEELETTNEELQSTNEELETMNEELQSTNEELQTINEELRQRGSELNDTNTFFGAVLGSLRGGVAVLDRELRVQIWNDKMEDLWGCREDEVEGKHFMNLDIGLPVDSLSASLRAAVTARESADQSLECTNRRGKKIDCKVSVMPLRGDGSDGIVVFVEEQRGQAT